VGKIGVLMPSTTLQILIERFNGVLMVRPVVAGYVVNMAKSSVYNRLSLGTFPLPVVETATGLMVRLSDLATYIDGLTPTMPIREVKPCPSNKGRPKKIVQLSAQRLGLSVSEYYARKG
jgi:hypothetical protein